MGVHISDSSLKDEQWKVISRSLRRMCKCVALVCIFSILFQAEFRADT